MYYPHYGMKYNMNINMNNNINIHNNDFQNLNSAPIVNDSLAEQIYQAANNSHFRQMQQYQKSYK